MSPPGKLPDTCFTAKCICSVSPGAKVWEEWWIISHPAAKRKAFRKNLQKLNDSFDKMMYDTRRNYFKQLSGMVNEPGKKLKS
jgi:hypothetical protein